MLRLPLTQFSGPLKFVVIRLVWEGARTRSWAARAEPPLYSTFFFFVVFLTIPLRSPWALESLNYGFFLSFHFTALILLVSGDGRPLILVVLGSRWFSNGN